MIKEVVTQIEKEKIIKFLENYNLEYENDITKTFYLEDDNILIGTVSISDDLIKCLCVGDRSNNYATVLITYVINYLYSKKIYSYYVVTKLEYQKIFLALSFKVIETTTNTVFLVGGSEDIFSCLEKMKKQIELKFNINLETTPISSVVLNANPFTIGHQHLVEYALSKSNYLVVFVVSEDKSYFDFKQRFTMVYLGCLKYSNVIVLPSSKYMISNVTFPNYFLKDENKKALEWMELDIKIFKNHFMKTLNINKRFVGSEDNSFMKLYNNTLKEHLNDAIEIIPRLDNISASSVRKYLKENNLNKALDYIPNETKSILRSIVNESNSRRS